LAGAAIDLAVVAPADFSAGLLASAAAARCGRAVFDAEDFAGVALALLTATIGAASLLVTLPESVFCASGTPDDTDVFADAAPACPVLTGESEATAETVLFSLDTEDFSDFAGTLFGVVTIVPSSIYEFQDSHIDVAMQQNSRWKYRKRQGYFREIEFTKHDRPKNSFKNKRAGKSQPVYTICY
jgi:hypothetical protein